jgi:hypothetical protein
MTTPVQDLATGATLKSARALLAQLGSITGTRSTGEARVVATGGDVLLPPNVHAVPVFDGVERPDRVVKVWFNPATVGPHETEGKWTVTSAGLDVTFVSNVGGPFVVPPGAVLRFDPPIAGLEPHATVLEPGITGGTDEGALARQLVLFDELDRKPEADIIRSVPGPFPAVVLGWLQRVPVEGRQGLSGGRSRAGRGVRIYWEDWVVWVLVDSATSQRARWSQGVGLTEAICGLLESKRRSFDGERLTVVKDSGVEIQTARRFRTVANIATFQIMFRTSTARKRLDVRTFNPWETTTYRGFVPAEPPDLPADLELLLAEDEMPDA